MTRTRVSFLIFQTCTMDSDSETADNGMHQFLKTGVGRVRAKSSSLRFRYMLLLTAFCAAVFLLFTIRYGGGFTSVSSNKLLLPELVNTPINRQDRLVADDFTIKTDGCTIPLLRTFDKSIKNFVQPPIRIKPCPYSSYPFLENNKTHIWIVTENFPHFRMKTHDNVTCCYKAFYRPSSVSNIMSFTIDDRVKYYTCKYFFDSIEVENEFIRVSCFLNHKLVHEQFFLFALEKPMMPPDEKVATKSTSLNSSYNVIILGIDSVSRLNFHRTMPRTLAFLKQKGSIELLGYNKVADNTFPNLIPMLLGIRELDLKTTCWPSLRASFDNCPFIWNWFKDNGYYTAMGEDSACMGTFNLGKAGFIRTPTDYYIHTFISEAEKYDGNNKDFNADICMGNKYFYKVLLDYVEDLTETLKNSRLFGFFWEVSMSHDYLNYPMVMDKSYENFLKNLDASNYLEETILFILSDHGLRWGEIRSTKQGRLEERLPLVHVLVPQSFRETYPLAYDNLNINRHRLITPFDIHATLLDLANLDMIRNENIKTRSKSINEKDRNTSLFLPSPKNKTCESAGIEAHWCTCVRGTKIQREGKEARKVALNLIKQLNSIVRDYPKCAQLKLKKVMEVTELVAGQPDEHEIGWREFMVVIQAVPGDGVFEATLRQNRHDWNLTGTISRLNLYGNQSECVDHYRLKLYCYCI